MGGGGDENNRGGGGNENNIRLVEGEQAQAGGLGGKAVVGRKEAAQKLAAIFVLFCTSKASKVPVFVLFCT